MKKVLVSCAAILLALCIGTGAAYAWYTYVYRGTLNGISIQPTEAASSDLGVNSSVTGTFQSYVSLGQSATLSPATSTDGVNFKDKNGASSTQYVAVNGYVKAPADTSTFRISEIRVAGEDEINKALRVKVTFNGETHIYAPVSGADGNLSICTPVGTDFSTGLTKDTPSLVNIVVWYEGTDSSCTSANANTASGAGISLIVEAE